MAEGDTVEYEIIGSTVFKSEYAFFIFSIILEESAPQYHLDWPSFHVLWDLKKTTLMLQFLESSALYTRQTQAINARSMA